MKYIAIGKDRNTFSSRQATLKLPPKTTKLYDQDNKPHNLKEFKSSLKKEHSSLKNDFKEHSR